MSDIQTVKKALEDAEYYAKHRMVHVALVHIQEALGAIHALEQQDDGVVLTDDEWADMVNAQECLNAEIADLNEEIADLKAELERK